MAILKFGDVTIEVLQSDYELNKFKEIITKIKLRRILDIGTYKGGSLLHFTQLAEKNATIISIDLPYSQGVEYFYQTEDNIKLYKSFGVEKNQDIHIILQDCHLQDTYEWVKKILNRNKLDVLFIDECHDYATTKCSFDMYRQLVRKGGIIGLHDIMPSETRGFQVHILWAELKKKYKCVEIYDDINQDGGGIGVVFL